MKHILNSIIYWEILLLLWTTLTMANRVVDLTGNGPFVPSIEELL